MSKFDGISASLNWKPSNYFTISSKGMYISDLNLSKDLVSKVRSLLTKVMRIEGSDSLDNDKNKSSVMNRIDRQAVRSEMASHRPAGSSVVIGPGIERYGFSPIKISREERKKGRPEKIPANIQSVLDTRLLKFYQDQDYKNKRWLEIMNEMDLSSAKMKIAAEFETFQLYTGFAMDNSKFGAVTKSTTDGIIKAINNANVFDKAIEKYEAEIMESVIELRDHLAKFIPYNSLSLDSLYNIKVNQENDGLWGLFLVHGLDPCTPYIGKMIHALTNGKVNVDSFIGKEVSYESEEPHLFTVADAVGYAINMGGVDPETLVPVILALVRTQKTGISFEEQATVKGQKFEFSQKKGKTRSVNPLGGIGAGVEAIAHQPFLDAVKEYQVSSMPSLQEPAVQEKLVCDNIQAMLDSGLFPLDLDVSGYDKGISMSLLATIIQHAVKPFFKAQYHAYLDVSSFILNYKVYMIKKDYIEDIAELTRIIKENPSHGVMWEHRGFIYVFTHLILDSGVKITHVGGSLEGLVLIHLLTPKIMRKLGYKWPTLKGDGYFIGCQAGDDILMGIPKELNDGLRHLFKTGEELEIVKVFFDVMRELGLDVNWSKLWLYYHDNVESKPVVFLQKLYCLEADLRGMGTINRFWANEYMAEYDKNFSYVDAQLCIISRSAVGTNSLFVEPVLYESLKTNPELAYLFNTFGETAFPRMCKVSGVSDLESLATKIGVDSYHWSLTKQDFASGNVPILQTYIKLCKNCDDILSSFSVSANFNDALNAYKNVDMKQASV